MTTLICLLAAVAFIVLAQPLYRATTQIFIEPRASNLVDSQIDLIKSSAFLNDVLEQEKAAGLAPKSATIDKQEPATNFSEEFYSLQKQLLVSRLSNSYVIAINVDSKNPERAARLANLITQTYIKQQSTSATAQTSDVTAPLDARIENQRDQLRKAEAAVEAYRQDNNLVSADGSLNEDEQSLELSNRLAAAKAETRSAEARLDVLKNASVSDVLAGASPEALTSQVVSSLRLQLLDITQREAEAVLQFGERHPSLVALRSEKDSVRTFLDQELELIVKAAEDNITVAKTNEEFAQNQLDELTQASAAKKDEQAKLRELEGEVASSRAALEELEDKAAGGEELKDQSTRVLSKAVVPTLAIFPNKPLVMAASLLGGLSLGSLLALIPALFRQPKNAARLNKSRKVKRKTMNEARLRTKAEKTKSQQKNYDFAPPKQSASSGKAKKDYTPPSNKNNKRDAAIVGANMGATVGAQGDSMSQSKRLFNRLKKRTREEQSPSQNAHSYKQEAYSRASYSKPPYDPSPHESSSYQEPYQEQYQETMHSPPPPQSHTDGWEEPAAPHTQRPYDEPNHNEPTVEERASSLSEAIHAFLPKSTHTLPSPPSPAPHRHPAPEHPTYDSQPTYPEHLVEAVEARRDAVGHGGHVYGHNADREISKLVDKIDGNSGYHDPYPPQPSHHRNPSHPRSHARDLLRKLDR